MSSPFRRSFSGHHERTFLLGIERTHMSRLQAERSLDEIARLVTTAEGRVVERICYRVREANPATFIGKGKMEEVKELLKKVEAQLIVLDDELSPVQNRNLESEWGIPVLDRTAVILDIFALRAQSREGKLQVELAQLEYLAPRLVGHGKTFSQQVGRIGTRGPGETALELDRRRIRDRATVLRKKIREIQAHRKIHRLRRESVPFPFVSLVGYTNAGKSTLLNAITGSDAFVEDKLFATLDPKVRRLRLPSGREALIADTVGFIRRLPHQLIEAFRATFEEIEQAHLLLHVIDASDPEAEQQIEVVEQVLTELQLSHKPCIQVLNKADGELHYRGEEESVSVSALKRQGLDTLLLRLDEVLREDFHRVTLFLPHNRGDVLSQVYRLAYVWKVNHDGEGMWVDCQLHSKF